MTNQTQPTTFSDELRKWKIKETWKAVPTWENLYEVSDFGNIRSLDRTTKDKNGKTRNFKGRTLSQSKVGNYNTVLLSDGKRKRTAYAHVLIAETFLGHIPDGKKIVVDHVDSDTENNSLSNLQLISHRSNTSKGWKQRKDKTSMYTGVCRIRNTDRWQANIQLDGKIHFLGSFDNEEDAAWEYQMELYHYKSMNDKW